MTFPLLQIRLIRILSQKIGLIWSKCISKPFNVDANFNYDKERKRKKKRIRKNT